MGLIESARHLAHSRAQADEEKKRCEQLIQDDLRARVDVLKANMRAALSEIDGAETPHGPIRVDLTEDPRLQVFALVWAGENKVAWFKAGAFGGDWAQIKARFYWPTMNQGHDGTWDFQELRPYHNGGWTYSNAAGFSEFLKSLGEALSRWLF